VGSGSTIQTVRRLKGSTSSAVYRISVERAKRERELVLRLFTHAQWLADEPDLALHEANSLQRAAQSNLPVPELVDYDKNGSYCGLPAVLMTKLPGRVELKPANMDKWLYQLAEALFTIHAVDASTFPWRYFSWFDLEEPRPPNWSKQPDLWKRAIETVLELSPESEARSEQDICFLHRDYHPTNVLWQNNQISGIVDWVNACRGSRCVDLAHCRANLVALYGVATADQFLTHYQSMAGVGFEYHPYWELASIVETEDADPDIYPPWIDFGVSDLTPDILMARTDEFLVSIMGRF
jgi:aminoglycoside phosphotransferase (APT) family kinase protein